MNFKLFQYLFPVYTALIVFLAVLPINSGDSYLNNNFIVSIRLDYLVHFAIFVPWMLLLRLFTGCTFRSHLWKSLGWIMAGFLLAGLTEALQYLIPYRSFNINDLLANMAGVALGSVFFFFRNPERGRGDKLIRW